MGAGSGHIEKLYEKVCEVVQKSCNIAGFLCINSQDNMRDGRALLEFKDGAKYEGFFVKGEMKGQGTMWFPNGDKYEGTFDKNMMNGHGTYFFSNGDKYEGEYRDGKRAGGTITQVTRFSSHPLAQLLLFVPPCPPPCLPPCLPASLPASLPPFLPPSLPLCLPLCLSSLPQPATPRARASMDELAVRVRQWTDRHDVQHASAP